MKGAGAALARRGGAEAGGDAGSRLVEARIRAVGGWRGERLAEVRRLVREAEPAITEDCKWKKASNPLGTPVWSRGGIVCTGESYREVVKLTFARGASLPDPRGLFNASLEGNARRAIDLREGDSLDGRAFQALVRAAVALNVGAAAPVSKGGAKGAGGKATVAPAAAASKTEKGSAGKGSKAVKAEKGSAGKSNKVTKAVREGKGNKVVKVEKGSAEKAGKAEGSAEKGSAEKAKAAKGNGGPRMLSGGNPQIAKADGDAPVQAYLAALQGWKREVCQRLDALVVREVPAATKAVKWNSPFYGVEGKGWFLSFHVFTRYVKVTFFSGTSLRPPPQGGSGKDARWVDLHEGAFDEAKLVAWIRQAAKLPGWIP